SLGATSGSSPVHTLPHRGLGTHVSPAWSQYIRREGPHTTHNSYCLSYSVSNCPVTPIAQSDHLPPSLTSSHELPRAPTSSHELRRAPASSHELPRVEPSCSVRAGRPRVATAQRCAPVYQHEERRGDEPLMSPPRVMPPLYQTTQPVLKSYRGV